jgi:hypothetical protein
VINPAVSYYHTFQILDIDFDGDLDIVTAELLQSEDPDEGQRLLQRGRLGLALDSASLRDHRRSQSARGRYWQ